MCAILDVNVAHEVLGDNRPPAGEGFFEWINCGEGKLVVGGKLLQELCKNARISIWFLEAIRAGDVMKVDDGKVNEKAQRLQNEVSFESDDHHVIALAQVCDARLLYSNDRKLHRDFQNENFFDKRGGERRIYTTLDGRTKFKSGKDGKRKQQMLRDTTCPKCPT